MKKVILALGLSCFLFSSSTEAQCVTSGSQDIPDDGILTIDFFVSGLMDSDLASPTQGICGVELDFMHEYLGDLTIFLISPSGTIVQLVGPVTTATSPTNLTRWNISFIPCMTPAMPDAGFAPVWSNLQSWNAFTPYSGTYHPHVGCLEDFNTGSANGLWRLIIEDNDVLQVGTITEASLIFCNPAGLQCIDCEPNGGTLNPAVLSLCEGDPFQSTSLNVDFASDVPSPLFYDYEFLLISGNSIIESGPQISASPAVGLYSVCGLSYLIADSAEVNSLLSAGDYSQLTAAISSGAICGDTTSQCVMLSVQPIPDTIVMNEFLCESESFSFGGVTYSSGGTYFQTHDGPGSCDTTFRIQITESQLAIQTNPVDTLSCQDGDLTITSMVSGSVGAVTYQWSSTTGNIIGSTTSSQILIDQPGLYLLTIADAECQVSSSVSVVADNDFPRILLTGGTLTCLQTSIHLSPIFFPADATVQWTGSMGFSADTAIVDVNFPGTYFFTVTSALGCQVTQSVNIGIDTATHEVEIILTGKNCAAQTATLANTDVSGFAVWDWSGPNNFNANSYPLTVSDAGLYTLTVSFLNGCQRSDSYFFDGDFAIPDIMSSPSDTLNCNETITLSISSITPGVVYGWSGPPGFSSNQSSVDITQVGTYYATVYAPNGCIAQSVIDIIKGNDIFDFSVFSDTIDCKTDTVQIGVIASGPDLFYWTNVPGADTTSPAINVTSSGIYNVIMVDTSSGCEVHASIAVPQDFTYPSFGYTAEAITCSNPVSDMVFIPFEFVYSEIYWILPDGTIVQGTTLSSNQPGEHQLIGKSPNGCIGIWRIHIPYDTLPPTFLIDADTLGCDQNGIIETTAFDALASIAWTGPNGFTSSDFNPVIAEPGIYQAVGTSPNGCSATVSIEVVLDSIRPDLQLGLDTLDCIRDSIPLVVSSSDQILNYTWTDANGSIISTNSTAYITDPGEYIVGIEGVNHCFTFDTAIIESPTYPLIFIVVDTLTCMETSVIIEASTDIANPVFAWSDINGILMSQTNQLNAMDEGPFIISVIGDNGCESVDTVSVPSDTLRPNAVIDQIGELRCQQRNFMLDGGNSFPSGVNFLWSTQGGQILSNTAAASIEAEGTGIYYLSIERQDNGCIDTASIVISEHPDAIQLAFFDIQNASCSQDSNGEIHLVALQGGILPVLSQLNGGPLQGVGFFQGLPQGSYVLNIIDAEGCEYDTTLIIESTNPFFVDAGPDQEIYLGDPALLAGDSDLDPSLVFSTVWDSLGIPICQNCPTYTTTPVTTTSYTFQVVSNTGCIMEDVMTVIVIERAKFYIADIFSPNGDQINDEIKIHAGPGIERVLKWIIYDRWGDAVFGKSDFEPNDPSVFWNGTTLNGEMLNPAVFPYLLEVELINGNVEIHHGTITLIR